MQVEQRFPQSKIDFIGTRADRYIASLHHRLSRQFRSGRLKDTPHKKNVAALLVELGYEYLRVHGFNVDKAKEAVKAQS